MLVPYRKVFTGPTPFPEPISIDGTFSTLGTKVITYDVAPGDLKVGDYLYSSLLNEIRKISKFEGDNPILENAFSSDLVDQYAVQVAGREEYTSITIDVQGDGDGVFNGSDMPAGTIQEFQSEEGVGPFTIDATDTEIAISAL